jgi:hypothetical protein
LRNVQGGQNTSAERAWRILKVKNRNGYMNMRNWNSAVTNMNRYNLTKNQKNIVMLTRALIKAGKPPGGGNRRRLHPNTFRRFKNEGLSGNALINQIKRNVQSQGGYRGRMVAKVAGGAALGVGAYMAAPHVKLLVGKYGPGVVDFLRKRANVAKNGAITNSEIQNLATNWKRKGFEIRNMNSFARYVRAGGNASNPNRAAAAFNKAFKNGVVSMVVGGAASSLGTAIAANKLSSIASALNKAVKATSVKNITAATNRINTVLGPKRGDVTTQNVMRAALGLKKALQSGQINKINTNTITKMYSRLPELQRVFRTFTGR